MPRSLRRGHGLLFFVLSCVLSGCALFGFQSAGRYDERSFSILNLNLFNQRIPSTMSAKHWKGDWLFRRERLELIDEQLRISRPDIIVLQELLTRRGSPSESDINILSYGALEGYEWDVEQVGYFKDTQEAQYQAVAVGLPLKLISSEKFSKKSWPIGMDGSMSYTLLEVDRRPILLVNVSMPQNAQKVDHWYQFIRTETRDLLKRFGLCSQRLLMAGYLPGGLAWNGYIDLVNEFELKDTATGFCEATADCLTSSNQNDLFMGTSQGAAPSHSERIMVHKDAIVSSSNVVMNKMKEKTVYGGPYNLQRLWASRVFGWLAEVRLPQCAAPDAP